jgi:hypothetical protein
VTAEGDQAPVADGDRQPSRLATELKDLAFDRVDDLGADELNRQYFADRTDDLTVGQVGRIVRAFR